MHKLVGLDHFGNITVTTLFTKRKIKFVFLLFNPQYILRWASRAFYTVNTIFYDI